MMVYYVIALGLFVSAGCREVLRRLLDGAKWIWPWDVQISTESAITQARQRLGSAPIIELYRQVGQPIARKTTRGAWYRSKLAHLYSRRWTIETAFDEIKTLQRQGRIVLRSKMPELVLQDLLGLMLAHVRRSIGHESGGVARGHRDRRTLVRAYAQRDPSQAALARCFSPLSGLHARLSWCSTKSPTNEYDVGLAGTIFAE